MDVEVGEWHWPLEAFLHQGLNVPSGAIIAYVFGFSNYAAAAAARNPAGFELRVGLLQLERAV